MFEELWPYAVLAVVAFLVAYSLKKITELKIKVRPKQLEENVRGLKLPNSIKEGLDMAAAGLQMQIKEIETQCAKAKKNPMDEVSYNTLVNQYNGVIKWQERFSTNPAYMMFDQIGYPIVRELIPDGLKMAKRLMKFA